jgi:hypothetical protein
MWSGSNGDNGRLTPLETANDSFENRSRSSSQGSFDNDLLEDTLNERGGEGFVLPSKPDENTQPFFFGIDCRSEIETGLGKFPKVYLTFLCYRVYKCVRHLESTLMILKTPT